MTVKLAFAFRDRVLRPEQWVALATKVVRHSVWRKERAAK